MKLETYKGWLLSHCCRCEWVATRGGETLHNADKHALLLMIDAHQHSWAA